MLRRVLRLSTMATLLAVAALGVGACGESDSDDSGAATDTEVAGGPAPEVEVPTSVKDAGRLNIAAFLEYPPYRYIDENQKPAGIEIKMAEAIAEKMGVEAEFNNIEFAALFPAVENGRFDFGLGANYKTVEREEVLDMLPWQYAALGITVKQGNPENVDPEDLCAVETWGETVGSANLEAARSVARACEKQGKRGPVIREFQDVATRFQALMNGQIQIVADDPAVIQYMREDQKLPVEVLPSKMFARFAESFPAGWSFTEGDEEMKTAVVQAIEILIEEGTWQKILEEGGIAKPIIPPSFETPKAVTLD